MIDMAKERNVIVSIYCPFCGADHEVDVNLDEYLAWQGGECIQYAMPNHSATEREQLISNMCPACQAKVFGTDED